MGDLITFAAAVAAVFPCALATPTSTCPDKLLPGVSIYQGGIVAASKMVANLSDCCELCHGDFKDECAGWEWIDLTKVNTTHNCDIMAKVGPPSNVTGRVAGLAGPLPPPPPPSPLPPQEGTPCHSDADCQAQWHTANWRCLERAAQPSSLNGCHMHATTTNTTCACQPSDCNGGMQTVGASLSGPLKHRRSRARIPNTTSLYVIGDSISMGMRSDLAAALAPDGWTVSHNPGNGDNSNYGAHCVPSWVPLTATPDVVSFQFGLHDIAHDEERVTLEQYTALLTNITAHLVAVQKQHGTKLLWVKTTPVPTVKAYGYGCNGTATVCLNPARFDADVVTYNAAADRVMAAAVAGGAQIATADLYSFVLDKCGGKPGYASCPGFQLPMNVHFTPQGWAAIAAEMRRVLLSL